MSTRAMGKLQLEGGVINRPNPVFAPVTMTVFPAKEALGTGKWPKSWPYTNLAKNAGVRSPGMSAVSQKLAVSDGEEVQNQWSGMSKCTVVFTKA